MQKDRFTPTQALAIHEAMAHNLKMKAYEMAHLDIESAFIIQSMSNVLEIHRPITNRNGLHREFSVCAIDFGIWPCRLLTGLYIPERNGYLSALGWEIDEGVLARLDNQFRDEQ